MKSRKVSSLSNLPFTVTLGKTFHFLGSHFTHTQCRNCTKWLQKALSIPCESIQHFLSNLKSCDILKGNVPWTLCGFLESWGTERISKYTEYKCPILKRLRKSLCLQFLRKALWTLVLSLWNFSAVKQNQNKNYTRVFHI